MKVDERILKRLQELLNQGEALLAKRRRGGTFEDDYVDTQAAHQWATSVESLLARVFGTESEHYKNFKNQSNKRLTYSPCYRAMGVLKAAKDDYENGHLFEVRRGVEAEVFDDFLEQAEHLLGLGYFQPAAVVAGAVLEDGLRKLCDQNSISLPHNPKLDRMNSDLAKAGVYSILTQKQVTFLADLRNKAAHGKWDEFTRENVDETLRGVRKFMEEHFA